MRNMLYYMCIIFLNNRCVNSKVVCDKKSAHRYAEIQKNQTNMRRHTARQMHGNHVIGAVTSLSPLRQPRNLLRRLVLPL